MADRFHVELRDVVDDPPAPTDWLVSVEVLEHLEDPVRFLRGLRALLNERGKAFVTTALNAPNADHIYLYRNAAEVCVQLDAAGFAIEQYFCALAGKPSSRVRRLLVAASSLRARPPDYPHAVPLRPIRGSA